MATPLPPLANLVQFPPGRTSPGPGEAPPAGWSSVVELAGGDGAPLATGVPPIFLVHGGIGNVVNLIGLAGALAGLEKNRSIYGLEAAGSMGGTTDPTITAMAGRYVTAIRGIQAAGPYVLGGFSIGGGIAMEMAAQLTRSGDAASVIILDGHTSLAPPPDHHKGANLIANARESGLRRLVPWAWRQVRWKLGRRHSPEMLRRLGNADPERLGYVDCEEAIFASGRAHSLRRVDVDVLLVKSAQLWPMYPSDYGWTPYVGGEFRVEVTPGDHLSMLDGPNVPALARAISRHLSRHL